MSYKLRERRLYDLGVSASQARVLSMLHSSGEAVTPTTVARVLFQETPSITGIVQRLEARGSIEREADSRFAIREKYTGRCLHRALADLATTV